MNAQHESRKNRGRIGSLTLLLISKLTKQKRSCKCSRESIDNIMAFYGRKEYWEERYKIAPDPYEFLQSYHGIKHLFTPFNLSAVQGMNPAKPRRILESKDRDFVARPEAQNFAFPNRTDCRVLIVGCGNSRLGEDMIIDGWTGGIVGVDWSTIVIDQMKAKYTDEMLLKLAAPKAGGRKVLDSQAPPPKLMEFVCADIVEGLSFQDGAFDLIVCKGCFDALVTGAGSTANARKLNAECHRLLNVDYGALVVVTHGNPESRIVFFENKGDEWWAGVGIHNISKPRTERRHLLDRDSSKFHYAYICRKLKSHTGKLDGTISCIAANEENDASVLPGNVRA